MKKLFLVLLFAGSILFTACDQTTAPPIPAEDGSTVIYNTVEVLSTEYFDLNGNPIPAPEGGIETQAANCSGATSLFSISSSYVGAKSYISCSNPGGYWESASGHITLTAPQGQNSTGYATGTNTQKISEQTGGVLKMAGTYRTEGFLAGKYVYTSGGILFRETLQIPSNGSFNPHY